MNSLTNNLRPSLALAAAAELELRRRRRGTNGGQESAPLWRPLPGPQTLAYESLADITGYGGAGGGGKSFLGLGLAITRHVKSIIPQRTSTTACICPAFGAFNNPA